MVLFGSFVNGIAIVIGAVVGSLFAKKLDDSFADKSDIAMGLCILVISLNGIIGEYRAINLIVSMAIGMLIGEFIDLDNMIVKLGQRIEKAMMVSMDKELDELDNNLGFLASTGSVAPLIGLFGTVWGIIDCFNAIAVTQSNSLTSIAPGIAEALFTTAFGLIAAIPAVVAYNKISSDLDRYAKKLEAFMSEFSTILSREIDDTAIRAEMAGE
jgi:biopolymer transport protein ExbB/TolQ